MKYRSPQQVLWLSFITLGFYDLYWLGATRNDLARSTGAKLYGNAWLVLLGVIRCLGALAVIWVALALFASTWPSPQAATYALVVVILVLSAIANYWLFPKWLIPYVGAAQATTNGRLQESNIMLMVLMRESFGITTLQQAYNNPDSMPAFMATDPIAAARELNQRVDNPLAKRILSIIAVVMAIGLVLLLLVPFFVAHIG